MTSIAPGQDRVRIIVGVDTHKHMHAAVAVDELGSRPNDQRSASDSTKTAAITPPHAP